jgi:hypothetical protein
VAIAHSVVSVNVTPTSLTAGVPDRNDRQDIERSIVVQNNSTGDLFLGGPSVSSVAFGMKVPAGASAAFDLVYGDELYAAVAVGSASINVMHLGV